MRGGPVVASELCDALVSNVVEGKSLRVQHNKLPKGLRSCPLSIRAPVLGTKWE
jgi:hypothetical protein